MARKNKTTRQMTLEREAEKLESIIYKGLVKLDIIQEKIDVCEAARGRDEEAA